MCNQYKSIIDDKAESTFFDNQIKFEVEQYNLKMFDKCSSFLQTVKNISDLPNLKKLFIIGSTVFVSTNSAERSFSKLNLIKSQLRTQMSQDRLSSIAVLNLNKEISIPVDDIVEEFNKSERRAKF